MTKLVDLPDVLIELIQTYCLNEDYHYFINCNQKYFLELKKRTIHFRLNHEDSSKYVKDEAYRAHILSKIQDPSKQISLSLKWDTTIPQLVSLSVQELRLQKFYVWSSMIPFTPTLDSGTPLVESIRSLRADSSLNLTSSSFLLFSKLQELRLQASDFLTTLPEIPSLRVLVLSQCNQITEITIDHCIDLLHFNSCERLREIKTNGKQLLCRTVKIHNCEALELNEFEQLSQVKHLTLSLYIRNLPLTLSHLYGIYDLSLIDCVKLSDISDLGNHHRLEISFSTLLNRANPGNLLKGYEILTGIRHVVLKKVDITDLSVLSHAQSVYLEGCDKVTDVSALSEIKDVSISFCSRITNFTSLKKTSNLSLRTMNQQPYLVDNDLQHVSLSLSNVSANFNVFAGLRHLIKLYLHRFPTILQLNDSSVFPVLEHIIIDNCQIWGIQGLKKVRKVEIVYCSSLRNTDGLGENHTVILSQCSNLIDVSSLVDVPVVKILHCTSLQHGMNLLKAKVPRLSIVHGNKPMDTYF